METVLAEPAPDHVPLPDEQVLQSDDEDEDSVDLDPIIVPALLQDLAQDLIPDDHGPGSSDDSFHDTTGDDFPVFEAEVTESLEGDLQELRKPPGTRRIQLRST